jgi:hypothetical protein
MGRFFYKLLLTLGKCCKTFQNTRITLFDQWRDSWYINIIHYDKKNACKIRFKKASYTQIRRTRVPNLGR